MASADCRGRGSAPEPYARFEYASMGLPDLTFSPIVRPFVAGLLYEQLEPRCSTQTYHRLNHRTKPAAYPALQESC